MGIKEKGEAGTHLPAHKGLGAQDDPFLTLSRADLMLPSACGDDLYNAPNYLVSVCLLL